MSDVGSTIPFLEAAEWLPDALLIVTSDGGTIGANRAARNLPGRGSTFKLLLPAEPKVTMAATAPAAEPPRWRGTGTALVIEDEESIRGLALHMLRQMGLDVTTANDGRDGVEVFRQMAAGNPLVLLDLTMPHLDGAETFAQLRRIRPDVRVILMSGYSENSVTAQFAGKGVFGFIQKPFSLSDLRQLVRSALRRECVIESRNAGTRHA